MGPSGSGKSTLLELISDSMYLRWSSKYNGIQRQLVSGDDLKKHIGFFTPGIKDFL